MGKRGQLAKLEQTVTAIQQRWGSRAIHKARQKDTSLSPPVLSTGFQDVDRILGIGGFPRGKMVELIASGTAGQATLAAKTLRQAQCASQQVAYVDVEHAIDLDFLVRCGVRFDALVILRPRSLQHALEMTGDLIREEGVGAITFDHLHPLLSGDDPRWLDKALRDWTPALDRSLCTLLFLTEAALPDAYPPGLPLPYFASVRLAFERQDWLYHRHQVSGITSRITVLKNKLGPSGRSVCVKVTFDNHIQGEKDG